MSEIRLNKAQKEAAEHFDGPCMVLAGPGSGKTAVISCRLKRLLERGVQPENILVITFTRAAAEEMKRRFLKVSGEGAGAVMFGTFHSVFLSILKESGRLRNERIMTDRDRMRLIGEVFRENFRSIGADSVYLSAVLSEISRAKNERTDPENHVPEDPKMPYKKACELYEKKKKQAGLLDFDDMLVRTGQLLKERPDVLREWQERFRYILIDEFQDINPVQYEIVRMLAAPEDNLFVVGDDDQSIYRFRSARPEIMLGFPKDYRKAKQVVLNVNYRSAKAVVKSSLSLINQNKERFSKKLKADREEAGAVTVSEYRDVREESERITEQVERYIEGGVPPEEIAVLARVRSNTSLLMEMFLERGIPFFSKDRIPVIFRQPVCRPVFAYLNYAAGNHLRRNFLLFMNCPVRYVRREDLTAEKVDIVALAARLKGAEEPWRAKPLEKLIQELRILEMLRTPYAMVNYIRKGIDYDRHVREQAAERHGDPEEQLQILDELQDSAKEYNTIEDWYRHIARYTREMDRQEKERSEDSRGKVTVSTIHGAKGLEYEVVFMPGVNEKVMPSERAKKKEEIEEERRIMYVGMTRAKKNLHLSSVNERFGKKTEVSRFIREI